MSQEHDNDQQYIDLATAVKIINELRKIYFEVFAGEEDRLDDLEAKARTLAGSVHQTEIAAIALNIRLLLLAQGKIKIHGLKKDTSSPEDSYMFTTPDVAKRFQIATALLYNDREKFGIDFAINGNTDGTATMSLSQLTTDYSTTHPFTLHIAVNQQGGYEGVSFSREN